VGQLTILSIAVRLLIMKYHMKEICIRLDTVCTAYAWMDGWRTVVKIMGIYFAVFIYIN
jgi:hypothetical protein